LSSESLEFIACDALGAGEARTIAAILAGSDPWLTLGYGADGLARGLQLTHPDLTRYLAVRNGAIQGLAVIRHPWLRGAYIELFAVLPGAQGQGVGRAVLTFIERTYRGRTANLWLLVSGFNAGARAFYEKQGFRPVGLLADLVTAGQDEVLMRKVIQAHATAARQPPSA
jgi:diamine N-acetyltransferase